ncbi:heparan-alpha-glucosaminide N-acetyltransferase domain-containing protein [Corynebacterium sp.]|uniref:heparan-alpha-glucosaminide N-acetyltransferase domain-containing protein n=1 Tax=Corynebacterium sp. TaxID=1720 RepID=UPI0026DB5307|nr:heparan-alpha-glucosaminide N-acetyltransferase domain-containing protein [Corynebacterium sp.]MDO5076543.1 heparan-alpha-glucosaminide N-acetyltransferase domain-containing protein [Corynebacterium sp.]
MPFTPDNTPLVPEGDIPVGARPQPGPRQPREAWTGGQPAKKPRRRASRIRIRGIDAARGFALFGMISVHTLPVWDNSTQTVTLSYQLLAGHAAALFATLAGVSLAIITGMNNIHTGRDLHRDRLNVFFRALIVLLIGTTINFLPLTVYNILPYYAFFFLFAIPFLGFKARSLFIWAAGMAIGGSLLRYIVLASGSYPERTESMLEVQSTADVVAAIQDPVTFLMTMVFTGVYPAITWIAFILLGMGIGRLDLRNIEVQIKLGVFSALVAIVVAVTSDFLLKAGHGFDRIVAATSGLTPDQVMDSLRLGGEVPSTTLWWQIAAGPHLNTVFSVVLSGALATFALSFFLLAERVVALLLIPFERAGSMTLTLYVLHLMFLAVKDVSYYSIVWCLAQIFVAMALGFFWREAVGQGPLERSQSALAKFLARTIIPVKQSKASAAEQPAPLPWDAVEPQPVAPPQRPQPQQQSEPVAHEPTPMFDPGVMATEMPLPQDAFDPNIKYPSRFQHVRSRHQTSSLPPREQQWSVPGPRNAQPGSMPHSSRHAR